MTLKDTNVLVPTINHIVVRNTCNLFTPEFSSFFFPHRSLLESLIHVLQSLFIIYNLLYGVLVCVCIVGIVIRWK